MLSQMINHINSYDYKKKCKPVNKVPKKITRTNSDITIVSTVSDSNNCVIL